MEYPSVLVVQPDVHFAKLITAALQAAGWTVFHTEGGRAARHELVSTTMDAALIDIDLEDMDGLELLAVVNRLPSPPKVLLCSRLPQVGSWDLRAREALGVAGVLVLPARPEEIVRALEPMRAPALTRSSRPLAAAP